MLYNIYRGETPIAQNQYVDIYAIVFIAFDLDIWAEKIPSLFILDKQSNNCYLLKKNNGLSYIGSWNHEFHSFQLNKKIGRINLNLENIFTTQNISYMPPLYEKATYLLTNRDYNEFRFQPTL